MKNLKPDKYDWRDFSNNWTIAKGTAAGQIVYKDRTVGNVRITLSRFRIDCLRYSEVDMISYANRIFIAGLCTGRYKEIEDAIAKA